MCRIEERKSKEIGTPQIVFIFRFSQGMISLKHLEDVYIRKTFTKTELKRRNFIFSFMLVIKKHSFVDL